MGIHRDGQTWAIVLAGGRGQRMQDFIKTIYGREVPKQFMAFAGGLSMLQHTVDRARGIAGTRRVLTVVTAGQDAAARAQLAPAERENLVVQPVGRETAPGVLHPLAHILARDPEAWVVIMPADHCITSGTGSFVASLRETTEAVKLFPGMIGMVGVQPESAVGDYGWIEPGSPLYRSGDVALRRVTRFVEKPGPAEAAQLLARGGMWNTLILTCRARVLWDLAAQALPELGERFARIRAAVGKPGLVEVTRREYESMPSVNISKELLERRADHLAVTPLSGVSWSDWGTPDRVVEGLLTLNDGRPAVHA